MLEQYGIIALLLIVAVIFPLAGIFGSRLFQFLGIRPNNPDPVKLDTYECGTETIGTTWVRFNFRYYYFALLFVIFDVETLFLYPWAVRFRQLHLFGFIEMAVFILILAVGYLYAWKKHALEWQ